MLTNCRSFYQSANVQTKRQSISSRCLSSPVAVAPLQKACGCDHSFCQ
jgi:hypothetical protein